MISVAKRAVMLAALGLCASTAHAADPKIVLSPSMVTNESVVGDAGRLFDEQTLAGNPAAGSGGAPLTKWVVPYDRGDWHYPVSAFIDLGGTYQISSVAMRDLNDQGDITISQGTPYNWTPVFTQSLGLYDAWNIRPTTGFQTRYVRVTLLSRSTNLSEIVLNGTLVSAAPVTPPPVSNGTRAVPTFDEFIGANAFNDDPIDKLAAVGFVREYHNWDWDESASTPFPNNLKAFNPSFNGFRFDDFYLNARNAGLAVAPAIQGSIASISGGSLSSKPLAAGADATLPASYRIHADHLFQFAARHGNRRVADSLLKLASGQPRTSGSRLINYYENWNEPDAWWHGNGRASYFSPTELAAMCSADYDGHRGAMGANVGVKNADPSAKMVMGGLADPNIEYLKMMKLWADANRGGSFPADVINVHVYSNDSGGQGDGTTVGISPEADNLKNRVETLVKWRNANVPNAEFWVSEFGYDVNPASVQRAPAIGATSAEEVQGQWLVRSYFALAAAGVDRAQMYLFRDVDANSSTKYDSSGLVTKKGEWSPRPSWYYVSTIKNRLKGMRFKEAVASGNTLVSIYKFGSADGSSNAYALWCPTSNNSVVSNYQMSVPGGSSGLKLITLAAGSALGVETPLQIVNGKVTIPVSERPVLVMAANAVWRATTVKISAPADGARFSPTDAFNVEAIAELGTSAGATSEVTFLRNGVVIGSDASAPYTLPQSTLAVGTYKYIARLREANGALFTSPEITISVSAGTGLKGQYFNGSDFNTLILTRIDPTINFDWGWNADSGPGSSVNQSAFSVRWTGQVQAIESGAYGFSAHYDDAMRVWISDGTSDRLVIDRWNTGASTYFKWGGTIYLEAGQKYTIKAEYAQRDGGSKAILYWQRPGQSNSDVIPQAQLYPAP